MTTVTGNSTDMLSVWKILTGAFVVSNYSPSGFTISNANGSLTVSGSDLTYSAQQQSNGTLLVAITGGTITGIQQGNGPTSQTWSGFSVSAVAAYNALGTNSTTFNNLFLNGNDTITVSSPTGNGVFGYDGNDTFNVSGVSFGIVSVDGGSGNDTLNLTGGLNSNASSMDNFFVLNVETINLAAGYNYNLQVNAFEVTAGNSQTVDASSLGASNNLTFGYVSNRYDFSQSNSFTGNITLRGGAGNDFFQGGSGNNIIDGGGGTDTVSFDSGYLAYGSTAGVTASLNISGAQSVGGPRGGIYTLSNIENLIGTAYSDHLTGNAGNNILNGDGGGNDVFYGMGGNDSITGSTTGTDTAIFSGNAADYTITHNGLQTTVAGPDGTDSLTYVDYAQFDDQTVQIAGISLTTANISAAHGQTFTLSSLASVNDLEGLTPSTYQLFDGNDDPASGHFVVNNVVQTARTVITVNSWDSVYFQAGYADDPLQIRATDSTGHASADANAAWSPFTVSVPVNHAPVLTTANVSTTHDQTLSVPSLFTVSDADGDTMKSYQIFDSSSDPSSGHFMLYGVTEPARTVITISASDMYSLKFVTGTTSDTLQIRASDGGAWSAADNASWAPFTITPTVNHAPVVTTTDSTTPQNRTLSLSSLMSVSDPDGDPITSYQLFDGNDDPNSGHFVMYGSIIKPARTVITISASDVSSVAFVTGTTTDTIQIRASDGAAWSAADNASWAPFTITAPPNHAPVVTTANLTKTAGQTLSATSLFSASDPDNDPINSYQLFDGNADPNSGHFVVSGVTQAARTIITLTSAQLSQASFVTGSTSDTIQIRAFDGAAWSAADNASWSPFTITAPLNHAPVVTTADVTKTAGQTLSLSSLMSVSDPDGDTITRYQLFDGNDDPASGHFVVNGVTQAARSVINITASQVAQTSFVTGSTGDKLQIRAFDGAAWSAGDNDAWAPFTIAPPPNHAPVVTTAGATQTAGQTLSLSSLVSASDADGDTITRYQLFDGNDDPNSGHFVINGVAQAARSVIDITAAQFAQTSFVTGSTGDTLQVRAFDGKDWSAGDNAAWAPFTIAPPANHPPVVTTANTVQPHGQTLALSSLISTSDADGDTITMYELFDGNDDPASGHFMINGVAQAARTVLDITAAQMAQTSFVTGGTGDTLQVRAFDGHDWSAASNASWAPFNVDVTADQLPVVTTADVTSPAGQTLALSSLFSVSDADGDAMTAFELFDGNDDPASGHFVVNGVVQPQRSVIDITAAQLAQTSFVTGSSADIVQIRAFDGYSWSAATNAAWAPFHIST